MSVQLFADLTRDELREVADHSLLVVPIGATEQHGPALPTATDTLHVEHVARNASALAGASIDIVVAPTVAYGCSDHHLPFGATLSLSSATLIAMLRDIGRSAVQSGFRRIFFLNGHGGNHEIVQLVARDLSLEEEVHCAGGSWWAMAHEALIGAEASRHGRVPGHAGSFEAAIVLAIRPDLVVTKPAENQGPKPTIDRSAPYRAEYAGFWRAIDGYSDDPAPATADSGRQWLEVAADAVSRHLLDFYRVASDLDNAHNGD